MPASNVPAALTDSEPYESGTLSGTRTVPLLREIGTLMILVPIGDPFGPVQTYVVRSKYTTPSAVTAGLVSEVFASGQVSNRSGVPDRDVTSSPAACALPSLTAATTSSLFPVVAKSPPSAPGPRVELTVPFRLLSTSREWPELSPAIAIMARSAWAGSICPAGTSPADEAAADWSPVLATTGAVCCG